MEEGAPKIPPTLAKKFRTVASGRLERLAHALLALERRPDDAAVAEEAMREIHTLKGEAKMMGFAAVGQVAHRAEEVMQFAQRSGFRVGAEYLDAVLSGFDLAGRLVGEEDGGASATEAVALYTEQVRSLLDGVAAEAPRLLVAEPVSAAAPPPAPGVAGGLPAPEAPAAPTPAPVGGFAPELPPPPKRSTIPPMRVIPPASPPGSGAAASAAEDALRSLMKLRTLETLPVPIEKLDRVATLLHDVLQEQGRKGRLLGGLGRTSNNVQEKVRGAQGILKMVETVGLDDPDAARRAIVRVQELLMDVTALQSDSLQLLSRLGEAGFNDSLWLREVDGLFREIRMVPLSKVFAVYPRAVRDLARQLGKMAHLEISGGSLGVDKNVLDRIGEPLLHLMRNALDHGIEPPAERSAAGKPAEGVIRLEATPAGARLRVTLADDGRGIVPERLRDVAVARGLMTAEAAAALPREALFDLLFLPGFSTRSEVTDISGRGVGLDVVKNRIEELGGAVSIASEPGAGTRFHLDVPLSLAMIDVVLVKQPEGIYGLPGGNVVTVVELSPGDVEPAGTGSVFRWEGELVPLVDLAELLGQPTAPLREDGGIRVVVLRHQTYRLGISVERVMGQRALVQKEPGPFVSGLPLLAGTAALGEGDGVLILSVPELFSEVRGGAGASRRTAVPVAPVRSARILVVEDSEITRVLLVEILRGVGYEVLEAGDGKQALDLLRDELPDLVLTDLDMPILNGFDLLRQLRSEGRTKSLPVVVFSARGAEGDQRRALELGADAYMVKSRFRETEMIETVRRYVPAARGVPA